MLRLLNRSSRFSQIVCFLLAVHFFNFSIDPKDPEPHYVPEDLSVNEIESIAEFFAEVVFGFTDAFAEHDENDNTDNSVDSIKIYFTNHSACYLITATFKGIVTEYFIKNTRGYSLMAREISTPPPEA